MRKIKYSILVLISIIFFSCQKKESNLQSIEKESVTKTELPAVQEQVKVETVAEKEEGNQIIPSIKKRLATNSNRYTKDIALRNFYKQNEKKAQQFLINTSKDTTIRCAENTKITFHTNSLVSAKTGKSITGQVAISVKEYYKMSDILLAKLSTTSNRNLLETGGMIDVVATSNGEKCELKKGKTIEIEFPTTNGKEDMQLFNGVQNAMGPINWVLDREALQYNSNVTSDVDEKPIYPGGLEVMRQFINNNINPTDEGLSGKINVSFVIDKEGNVIDIKILKGLSKAMDNEVIRVIQKLKRFTPAKKNGIPVKTSLYLPITIYATESIGYDRIGSKESFQKTYKDDGDLKKARANEINFYLLSSTKLGMINCDRFLKENINSKIEYAINFKNDSETSINMVFHRIKAFMTECTTSKKVSFKGIPSGEDVTIIAIKYIQNEPYLSIRETNTSKVESALVFQPVTLESLKSEMKKLDRFN